jgi:hypothetical protein
MDWTFAIDRHRDALKRVLAMLVGMAGLAEASGEGSFTLPRHLHRAILRLLRPAESAARRLVIVAARGLVVDLPPLRQRKPKPTSLAKPGGTGIIMPPGPPRSRRTLALPLFDSLRSPLSKGRPRYQPQASIPRISFPGSIAPSPIAPRRPPWRDDPLDATRLMLRLQALAAALDDLPRHAKRFARWKAGRDAAGAQNKETRVAGAQNKTRSRRAWPLRPGRPPGQRAQRHRTEVHEILQDLHGVAFDVLDRRDTS